MNHFEEVLEEIEENGVRKKDDMEKEEEEERVEELKLRRVATNFRRCMHFYGLAEDVSLLLDSGGRRSKSRTGTIGWLGSLVGVLLANLVAFYALAAHLAWEYRQLEAKGNNSEVESATSGIQAGWPLLKELLENLRRHMSRIFSLALMLTWHLACRQMELLFVDCRRQYVHFHFHFQATRPGQLHSKRCGLRRLASHRLRLAIGLPLAHLLFNLLAVSFFPPAAVGPSQARANRSSSSLVVHQNETLGQLALNNFRAFHLAIHTAFHPLDHRLLKEDKMFKEDVPIGATRISDRQSIVYCLLELSIYSIYFHGPRIVCATCLSLVLHIHCLCLEQFGHQLQFQLSKSNNKPALIKANLCRLVKHYDMIGRLHERIERTFKWSILLWFSLMFISCLMHIFSFTAESASAFGLATSMSSMPLSTPTSSSESPATAAIVLTRLASIFFVCYPPALIYREAFRLEAANQRVEWLLMRLSRRRQDPLAQSLELGLFEPIHLSVGDYFRLSKRSMSSLLGAIVTFSVMFIAAPIPGSDDVLEISAGDELDDYAEEAGRDNDAGKLKDDDGDGDDYEAPVFSAADNEISAGLLPPPKLGLHRGVELNYQEVGSWSSQEELGKVPPTHRHHPDLAHHHHLSRLNQTAQKLRRQRHQWAKASVASTEPPRLPEHFEGRLRENERRVELVPKLRLLNQAEVCDFELLAENYGDSQSWDSDQDYDLGRGYIAGRPSRSSAPTSATSDAHLAFLISWVDRVKGEAVLEAKRERLMDCERQRNYTLKMRAIGCNGLHSNEATVSIHIDDVNEFSPEFQRPSYEIQVELEPSELAPQERGEAPNHWQWRPLLEVSAQDADCSREFGSICSYELIAGGSMPLELLSIDPDGRISLRRGPGSLANLFKPPSAERVDTTEAGSRHFRVIAYDCAGKKSQRPAQVQLHFGRPCRAALKDVEQRLVYQPGSAERSPFQRARLELCGTKCPRPNISLTIRLESSANDKHQRQQQQHHGQHPPELAGAPGAFHCDRDTYSMVSKRRLCGARNKIIELLPPPLGSYTNWLLPLAQSQRHSGEQDKSQRGSQDPPLVVADDTLNTYSPEGVYGRHALRYARELARKSRTPLGSASEQQPPRMRGRNRRPAGSEAAMFVGGARRRQQRSFQRQQEQGGAPSDRAQTDAVYRDLVYHLDGRQSPALVPRSVYLTQQQQPNGTSLEFLFGRQHTLSFWMRHAPFRFAQQHRYQNSSSTSSANDAKPKEEANAARHQKEHVLCASLDSGRHYYALYVRNCKLVLLMRRLDQEQQEQSYQPSEWRWQLEENQACDNKWHLYSLNMNYPQVELYVDGRQFDESYDNPAIVDDLPLPPRAFLASPSVSRLHQSPTDDVDNNSADLNLQLAIGACWDPQRQLATDHFQGHLSGLSVLAGEFEDSARIECIGRCTEELVQVPASAQHDANNNENNGKRNNGLAKLDNSLVAYQESQARILLMGHDLLDVEDALRQIAYINRRPLPSIGRRSLVVETIIECKQQQHQEQQQQQASSKLVVEPVRAELEVVAADWLPVIHLTSLEPNLARDYEPFVEGVKPFSSIQLRLKRFHLRPTNPHHLPQPQAASQQAVNESLGPPPSPPPTSDSDYIDDTASSFETAEPSGELPPGGSEGTSGVSGFSKRRIEACSVRVWPPLNGLHEALVAPVEQIESLGLYWRQSPDTLTIYGLDSAPTYEHLIHSIVYRNQKPAYYLERHFRLLCSDLNGRLLSNEHLQTVTIIHQQPQQAQAGVQTEAQAQGQQSQSQAGDPIESGEGTRPPGPSLSLLKKSELSQVELVEPSDELLAPSNLKHELRSHNQPLSMLSLDLVGDGSQLDKLAVAFLVFVVSMLVITLIITLAYLKEQSADYEMIERKLKRMGRQRRCNYLSVPDDEEGYDGSEEEEEEDAEEEEEEEEELGEEDEVKFELVPSERLSNGQHRRLVRVTSREFSDMESLAWDEEWAPDGEEFDEPTRLVMNPLSLHHSSLKSLLRKDLDAGRSLVVVVDSSLLNGKPSGFKSRLGSAHTGLLVDLEPQSQSGQESKGLLKEVTGCYPSSTSSSEEEVEEKINTVELIEVEHHHGRCYHHHQDQLDEREILGEEEEEEEESLSSGCEQLDHLHRHHHHHHHHHHCQEEEVEASDSDSESDCFSQVDAKCSTRILPSPPVGTTFETVT